MFSFTMFADLYTRSSSHQKHASGCWLKMMILSELRIWFLTRNAHNWRLHHYPHLQPYLYTRREVPYIWVHKRDYISHFEDQSRFELLNLKELWRINSLGQKYRSLLKCQKALATSYERLQVKDEYYEDESTLLMIKNLIPWLMQNNSKIQSLVDN